MTSSSLRAALIGFGQVAEKAHLPAFSHHGVHIAAVCESDAQRLKAARLALPSARFYASYERLLKMETGLDFVDIATPPFLHATQALAALRAGLHVLCEKPLSLLPDELDALRRSAAAAGRAVFTVHNWAYSPQWLKIYELADDALGQLRHVELHALRTRPAAGAVAGDWRRQPSQAGGGILVDHGWHNLYLLQRLLKARPNRVNARLRPGAGRCVEDEASLFIEFPRATALIYLSWKSPVRRNMSLVVGTEGVLELGDDKLVLRKASGTRRFLFSEGLSAGSSHPAWFSQMLPDFFAEVADPSRRGRNLEEASFCLEVINLAAALPQEKADAKP